MALWFFLILIGMPIAEIAVFIEAGDRFGLWPTVGGIVATAVIGMAMIRMQGLTVLRRVQENLQAERFPAREIFDGLCLLIAGAMLVTPGFITDTFGFLLLVVPLRRMLGAIAWRQAEKRGFSVMPPGMGAGNPGAHDGTVIDGEFHDVSADPTRHPNAQQVPPKMLVSDPEFPAENGSEKDQG
jgi:UPF0716 protein FxsA